MKAFLRWALRNGALLALLVLTLYVLYLDSIIRVEFEGKRWTLPAHVYARPLEMFPGMALTAEQLETELNFLGYRTSLAGERSGSYQRERGEIRFITRPFQFPDGAEPELYVRIRFSENRIVALYDLRAQQELSLVRLDPYRYASIFPSHHEDRILLQRHQLPEPFVKGLMAVEDRQFQEHHGLDFRGLARAAWANLTAMKLVQGGSTLTQQLVKNYFLTSERTLARKLKEAIMAVLLELHYSKDEILEAYVNEVYVGQDGQRAIHGLGLASQFYFGTALEQLGLPERALLIGLVKGPSYYDPRRHPERAIKRRNQVLAILAEQGVVTAAQVAAAAEASLGVKPMGGGSSRFPAFVELVRQQLSQDYREEDLQTAGLQIFTTLDPLVQREAEVALQSRLRQLEQLKGVAQLEGAVVVTATGSGEVLAIVGGRDPQQAGFNRALAAKRQIGSLIKPAVYLTALEKGSHTLASTLSDEPLSINSGSGAPWRPQNFDKKFHGEILLYEGLVNSLNVATVRLGMAVGVPAVIGTLQRLGIKESPPAYPSLLLGSIQLSPLEVTQMYQTFADGGFITPLRTIRAVTNSDKTPLQRYPLYVDQAANPGAVYLVNSTLQQVVRSGTAKRLTTLLPPELGIAGKTGTSNDTNDSWFAGFTGDRLGVVWVGRDDNKPTRLTGSLGALRVWGDLFGAIHPLPLELTVPSDVDRVWIDRSTGQQTPAGCENGLELPFIRGSEPQGLTGCEGQSYIAPLNESVD